MATVGTQFYLGNTFINNAYLGNDSILLKPFDNNLLLYLNAGNTSSYSGTGTSWYDLSGQTNTATLVNSPTFTSDGTGSFFTFSEASDSYATTTNTYTNLDETTLIAFINSSNTQTDFKGILYASNPSVPAGMVLNSSNKLGGTWKNSGGGSYFWSSNLTIPNNEWVMVAITFSLTATIAYLYKAAGATSEQNPTPTNATLSEFNPNVANNPQFGSFDGKLNFAQFYNRALTNPELDDIWNSYKGQVGL
jgi:hypothetical protein